MATPYVITWRPFGDTPYFFRGYNRHGLFLPFISDERIREGNHRGWTRNMEYARVFDGPPLFEKGTLARGFITGRLKIFPYEGAILPTQIFKPLSRPRWR